MTNIIQFPGRQKLSLKEETIERILDAANAQGVFRADLKIEIQKTWQIFQEASERTATTLPTIDPTVWASLDDTQRSELARWAQAFIDHITNGIALPALARVTLATNRVLKITQEARAMGFEIAD